MAVRKTVITAEEQLAALVENALIYLSCSDGAITSKYRDALVLGRHAIQQIRKVREQRGLKVNKIGRAEVPSPWSSSVLASGGTRESEFDVMTTACVPFSERLRLSRLGVIPKITGELVKNSYTRLCHTGRPRTTEGYFYRDDRSDSESDWLPVRPERHQVPTGKRKTTFSPTGTYNEYMQYALGEETCYPHFCNTAAWATRNLWHVRLEVEGGSSILYTTDEVGVKGFFQCRDKPEGRTRREALVHWVREHWRSGRDDDDAKIFVRKHLRGAEKFEWFGLIGSVLVPESQLAEVS